jgi:hypothetical protein
MARITKEAGRKTFPGPIVGNSDFQKLLAAKLLEPSPRSGVQRIAKGASWGPAQAKEAPKMTVLVYVNTSKRVGDADHLKVFANADAAETWLEENDPEGVAFEYEVLE